MIAYNTPFLAKALSSTMVFLLALSPFMSSFLFIPTHELRPFDSSPEDIFHKNLFPHGQHIVQSSANLFAEGRVFLIIYTFNIWCRFYLKGPTFLALGGLKLFVWFCRVTDKWESLINADDEFFWAPLCKYFVKWCCRLGYRSPNSICEGVF